MTARRTAPPHGRGPATLATLALLAGCLLTVHSPALEPASASTVGLQVTSNQLSRDGAAFLPRGFNMIGLLAPAWCTKGQGPLAASHFGQPELDAAKAWNANTLRFQVSQRGLADPAIAQTDRDLYLQHVVAGVQLARSNGFVVIVSMQDQGNGCGQVHPLPSDLTASAWSVLAPALMADPYVMFELFNEPAPVNTAAAWVQWRDGGTTPSTNLGAIAVGHQALIDGLRSLGATNVIIADGLSKAGRLAGVPMLDDEIGQLMYGVHPYYLNTGPSWWDEQWGYLTSTMPVIATEWNYVASACTAANISLAQQLMPYLQQHNVGLLAHAFDVPGHTITNDWSWSPTDCATSQGGSGKLTKDYFATQTDGPAPPGPVPTEVTTPTEADTTEPDTTAPTAPTGLAATASAPSRVDLAWTAATDENGVVGYRVSRDGTVVGETGALTYADTTVEESTAYGYTVAAVDAAGNVGPTSDLVTATTPAPRDTTAPTAPRGLTATLQSPTSSSLSWLASTDEVGVVGYQVVRDGATIGSVPGLTYADTAMPKSSTHVYAVRAVDSAGNVSPASTGVTVIAPSSAAGGLTARYYDTASFTTLKRTRTDATVNFAWGTQPPVAGMGSDTFSVRWTGRIIPRTNGVYTFYTQSDDAVRLWVDGRLLVNSWTNHASREDRATITLKSTRAYTIQVDYRDNTGSATARLSWSSPGVAKAIVPVSQLLAQ